jgi:para-nitrobenzyl esterase
MQTTDSDRKLTDRMGSYWTNFARTGDPNGQGLPEWPALTAERDVWMKLDAKPEPIEGLRARKLDILEEALRNRIDAVAGPPPEPPPPPAPTEGELAPVLGSE